MYHNHLDIGFRPVEEKDIEILRKLRNDKSTFLNLGTAEMSHSEDQYNWWKNHSFNSKNQRYTLVEKNTKKILGILRILNIDNINSNCEIGVDILPEERNKGFATKAYKCVLEYLFKHKNMHTIYLKVADFNPKAEILYERIGFVKTGYLSEYLFRNGKYWNYNIMCITFNEYIKKYNINTAENF